MTPLFRKFLGINWLLVLTIAGLIVFGIFSIHSATAASEEPGFADKWRDQVMWAIIGTVVFFATALIDYRWVKWLALPAYLIGLALLLALRVFGEERSGAVSWINFGFTTLQPSQVAIVGGILIMAVVLAVLPKAKIFQFTPLRLLLIGICGGVPMVLVLLEPDMGSAAVWGPVIGVMLLVGNIPFRYLFVITLLGLMVLPVGFNFGLKDYQKTRVTTYIDMALGKEVDIKGAGYQYYHNTIAIGSAGWSGKGYKGSRLPEDEKTIKELGFIPVAVAINDFIFVVIFEEHGLRGAIILTAVLAFFFVQLLFIAVHSRDLLGQLLVLGLAAQLFFHVFMNIGMCVVAVPITGLPLPLISYGGTFLVLTMFMLGLSQSVWVHRNVVIEEKETPKADFRG